MVTLVWRGGRVPGGGTPPPPTVSAILILPCPWVLETSPPLVHLLAFWNTTTLPHCKNTPEHSRCAGEHGPTAQHHTTAAHGRISSPKAIHGPMTSEPALSTEAKTCWALWVSAQRGHKLCIIAGEPTFLSQDVNKVSSAYAQISCDDSHRTHAMQTTLTAHTTHMHASY